MKNIYLFLSNLGNLIITSLQHQQDEVASSSLFSSPVASQDGSEFASVPAQGNSFSAQQNFSLKNTKRMQTFTNHCSIISAKEDSSSFLHAASAMPSFGSNKNQANNHPMANFKFSSMKKFLASAITLLVTTFSIQQANAQLSGTLSIPGDYASISAAVTALNTSGVGSGGVTFNVAAGYTETLTAKIIMTATGTSGNPIIFQKSGVGANPKLTSYTGGVVGTPSVVADGLIVLSGSDYVTFDGIDLQENSSNTTAAACMEFGYLLRKNSATDGCQYNTIKNCVITLNRVNNTVGTAPWHNGSHGIAVMNARDSSGVVAVVTPTSFAGTNSYNSFYSNTVQQCNAGIVLIGYADAASPSTLTDLGNDIGGSSLSTGNTILNFGGGATTNPATGIFLGSQAAVNCRFNTVTNNNGSGKDHGNTLRGIYWQGAAVTSNGTCSDNIITLSIKAISSQLSGIEVSPSANNAQTININNNVIVMKRDTASATGTNYGIYSLTATPGTLNVNGNKVGMRGANASGAQYMIYNTCAATSAISMSNNRVDSVNLYATTSSSAVYYFYNNAGTATTAISMNGNILRNLKPYSGTTGGSGAQYFIYNAGANLTLGMSNNVVDTINLVGTSTIYGIYFNGTSAPGGGKTVQNNTFKNFTRFVGTSGTMYILYGGGSSTNAATHNISGNTVQNINNSLATTALMYGFYTSEYSSIAVNHPITNVYNNIYDNISTGYFIGIYGYYLAGTSTTPSRVYNNQISRITSYTSTQSYPISVGYYSNYLSVYNNTIYGITNASTAALAQLCGIFVSQTSTTGTGPNNIYNNKIYSLVGNNAATFVSGIYVAVAANPVNIYNNLIGDLQTSVPGSANQLMGIQVAAGASVSVDHNTVYMSPYNNSYSAATLFGTSGVYHVAGANLTMRNNVIINKMPNAGANGYTAAFRMSGRPALTNYSTNSNNNIFFASATANAVLYHDTTGNLAPTNAITSISAYRTYMATRDQASQSEDISSFFISADPSNSSYGHIAAGSLTLAESGGTAIASITTDIDGDARNATTPDVGADEFAGSSPAPGISNVTITPSGTQCTAIARTVTADVVPSSGTLNGVVLNYSFNGVAQTPVTMTNTSGNTYSAVIPAATPANATVTWSIVATNSVPLVSSRTGTSYSDEPLLAYSVKATATNTNVCAGNTTQLAVGAYSSSAPAYSNPPAVSNPTTDEDLGNVTLTDSATSVVVLNNTTPINSLVGTIGTAAGTAGSFSDFTAFGPYNMTAGNTYNFSLSSLQATTAYGNSMAIYIDYNRNGVFTDAGEAVYVASATTSGAHTETGKFKVPTTAYSGLMRMRVVCNEGTITGPNMALSYGEREDYLINMTSNLYGGGAALPAVTYQWTLNGSVVSTSQTYTPTINATGTYYGYVVTTGSNCPKGDSVVITAIPLPAAPDSLTGGEILCGQGTPKCKVGGAPGATFKWYLQPVGGTAIAGQSADTLSSAYLINVSTRFYVSQVVNGCEGPRTGITSYSNPPEPINATTSRNGSICLYDSDTLKVSNIASSPTAFYTYTWYAVSDSTNAGLAFAANAGTSGDLSVTPLKVGTFKYRVVGRFASCLIDDTVSITVKALPVISSSTATPSVTCAYDPSVLQAKTPMIIPASKTIVGSGYTATTSSTYIAYGVYNSEKSQFIYTPAELTAAGLLPGNINGLSLSVSTAGGAQEYTGFSISMGTVDTISFRSTFTSMKTGLTTVYSSASTTFPAVGNQYFAFSTPFNWDGTSNIIIQFCWGNNSATSSATTSTTFNVEYKSGIYPGAYMYGYSATAAQVCAALSTANMPSTAYNYTTTYRPRLTLNGNTMGLGKGSLTWQWNPGAISGDSVVVNPTVSTVYTVSAFDPATGCTNFDTANVTVNPLPDAPVTTPSSQCGFGVPAVSATGGSAGQYRWYLQASGGSALAGQNNGTLSGYNISSTTTFYVAINNGTCESFRTSVLATVIQPDSLAISSSGVRVCRNTADSTATLTVTKTTNSLGNTYSYSWIASPSSGSGLAVGATGDQVVIKPTLNGTYVYTVVGTDATLGCQFSTSISLATSVPPVIDSTTASVTSICEGASITLKAYSTSYVPGPQTLPTGYCAQGGSATTADEQIYSFTFGSMTNAPTEDCSSNNKDYTSSIPPVTVYPGDVVPFSVDINECDGPNFSSGVSIFIDYNRDGDFADAGETVYTTGATTASPYTKSGFITIPEGITSGLTRLRVINIESNASPTACGTFSYGEVEDYAVNLVGRSLVNPNLTYTWNPGGVTGSTVTVTPAASTSYTVTASDAVGCSRTSSPIAITVNPIPLAPVATSSTQCGVGIPTASVTTQSGTVSPIFYWWNSATPATYVSTYSNDFSLLNYKGASPFGNTDIVNGKCQLTADNTNQYGALAIPAGGVNAQSYRAQFDIITKYTAGGNYADGLSYSFGDDVDSAATTPAAETGTGSKLKISFDRYGVDPGAAGIRVIWGNTITNPSSNVGTNGVLGYTSNQSWLGRRVPVVVDIDAFGRVTVKIDDTVRLSNIQLPADYLSANKALWRHVFKGRTGGYSDKFEIDNINLQYYNSGLLNTGTTFGQPVSQTTTWYVSESNGACEGPRVPVTATVIQPDSVAATASPSSVCVNQPVTLTATTTTGSNSNIYKFSWSAAAGSGISGTLNGGTGSFGSPVSVTVNPTAAGTYVFSLNGTDSSGLAPCRVLTTTAPVKVNGLPNIDSVKANKSSLCLGDSLRLTAYSSSLVSGPQTLLTYCAPTHTATSADPWITNVTFNTLNYSSGATAATPHVDVVDPSVATTTLQAGATYALSLTTTGTTYPNSIISVWFDWNRDGVLNATDEYVQPWTSAATGTVNVTVPATAAKGAILMRVRTRGSGNTNGAGDACTTGFGSGEAEDFTVYVISGSNINTNWAYSWTPGGQTGYQVTATPSAAGTTNYVVTVTDTLGCQRVSSPVSVLVRELPAVPTVANSTQCGQGVPTATATLANATDTLRWYHQASGGSLLQNGGSTYAGIIYNTDTLYVCEFNGFCESPRVPVIITVTPPPAITVSATAVGNTICNGDSTVLSVTSANADYTYSWSGGVVATGNAVTVRPTATTSYTVTATDASGNAYNGCATSQSITITVNPLPAQVYVTVSDTTACKDQTINLTASATYTTTLTGPQTLPSGYCTSGTGTNNADEQIFAVSFGSMVNNQTESCSSNYTDYTGSIAPVTVNAGQTYPLSVTVNECDGATYYSSGVSVFIDYNRNGVFTDAGEQVFTTTATVLNPHTETAQILIPAGITPGLTRMRVVAAESNASPDACTVYTYSETEDYAVNLIKSTTVAPTLLYSWSSNPGGFATNAQNPSGVLPATYSNSNIVFTVKGADPVTGCYTSASTPVIVVSDLNVDATATNVLCYGASTATITANGTGGIAPYQYSLNGSNYSSSNVFSNKPAGTYVVRIKDGNSPACVVTDTVVVSQPASAVSISLDMNQTHNPVCHNDANGYITVTATGGTGAIEFSLNGGTYQSSGTFSNLPAGNYSLTARDANGCTATTTVTLGNPDLPTLALTNNGPVCAGSDAKLYATTNYLSYVFSGPGSIQHTAGEDSAVAVAPADSSVYSVTITDALGCQNTATTVVRTIALAPVSVSISAYPTGSVCAATPVTFTATPVNGGTTPSYKWFVNGVQVSGASGSSYVDSTLQDQDVVTCELYSSIRCVSGNPATSNAITISIASIVPASLDSMTVSANDVCAGTSVTYKAYVTPGVPNPRITFYVNSNPVQSGLSDTYTYVPANGDVVSVNFSTDYPCAFVLDSTSDEVTMVINPIPSAPVISASGPTTFCDGGSVTLTSSYTGGAKWSTNATTDAITVTTSGTFTVTYTSIHGCTSPASDPVVVTNNANPTVTISGSPTYCPNLSTTLTATATAGSGTISSYAWTLNGSTSLDTFATQVANTAGSYTVTITNSNGCSTTSAPFSLSLATPPVAGISANCTSITPDQSVILTATPATGVTYAWSLNGGATLSTANPYTAAPSASGTFRLYVTDVVTGCQDSTTQVIGNISGPIAGGSTFNIPDYSCGGFVSINGAVKYLNANGVTGSGQITFNVAAGHTETAPAKGITLGGTDPLTNTGNNQFLATQSSATPVVFQKSGSGANPLVTAAAQTAGSVIDAVIRLRGADYITFDGIDVRENAANTVTNNGTNTMTEFGYALFANDTTNGSQYNTIKNCNISLKTGGVYASSFGIYSNARHNADSTTTANITDSVNGTNSYNKYYANSISNVNIGIALIGSTNINRMDKGNDIGGTDASTGNSITGWGGFSTAASYPSNSTSNHGIYNMNQLDNNISYNTITSNVVSGTSVTFRGVLVNYSNPPTAATTTNVNNNTITLRSAFTSGAFECVSTQGISTANAGATINMNNNSLVNCAISGAATSSAFIGLANLSAVGTLNINGNTIKGVTTTATTGGFTAITSSGAVVNAININNNNLGESGTPLVTFSATTTGTVTGISNSGAAATCATSLSNNTIRNASLTGAFQGIINSAASASLAMNNNVIGDIAISASAAFTGIYNSSAVVNSISMNNNSLGIGSGNTVTYTGAASSGAVYGLYNTSAAATASISMNGNNLNKIVHNVKGSGTHYYLYNSGTGLNLSMSKNTFTNMNHFSTGACYFLYHSYSRPAGGTKVIDSNSIVGTFTRLSGNGTTYIDYDCSSSTGSGLYTFRGNNFSNMTFDSACVFTGITNCDGGGYSKVVTGNTFTNITKNTTANGVGAGLFTGMSVYYFNDTSRISNNTISNISWGGTGGVTAITIPSTSTSGTSVTYCQNNTLSNIASTGTGGAVYGITSANLSASLLISNNTISNISTTGASGNMNAIVVTGATNTRVYGNTISGVFATGTTAPANHPFAVSGGTLVSFDSNFVSNVRNSGTGSFTLRGIHVSGGTTVNVRKNKFTDFQATRAFTATTGPLSGIAVTGGTTVNLVNNIIGDLRADSANSHDAIRGISVDYTTASTTINAYYNTVRLAAAPVNPSSVFGTSAIYHTVSTTATTASLNLRNNIFVNKSTPQGTTGYAVAYRRSDSARANFALTSNNNLYYAGTPGSANLIYYARTKDSIQTLAAYKTKMASREISSISEDAPFLSTTSTDATYLHIDPSVATGIEGGAVNIAGTTDDFDGNVRQGNPGYAGTSVSGPDMGADEMDGTPPPCSGTPTAGIANTRTIKVCSANTTATFTQSNYTAGGGVTYAWKVSTDPATGYVPVTGGTNANTPSYTTPNNLSAGTYYYILEVACSASGLTDTSSLTRKRDTLVVTQTPTAFASSNSPLCSDDTLRLTGTTDLGITFSWTGPSSFASALQNPKFMTTAASGGKYYFTATYSGCSRTDSTAVVVGVSPSNVSISPASVSNCAGKVAALTVSGGLVYTQLGTGSVSNTTTTPYKGYWGGSKAQFLYSASELTAQGLTAGSVIGSLGMSITTFTSPYTYKAFTIAMKNTSSSALTSTFETGASTVFGPVDYALSGTAPFDVNHTLATPFTWDGTSNILVEFCFNNNDGGGVSANSADVKSTTVTGGASYYTADNTAGVCTNTSATTSTTRVNLKFGIAGASTISWSPTTELFLDSAATVPYTGQNVAKVFAKATSSRTYTASATNTASGCVKSATANLTIRPLPTATFSVNSTSVCQNGSSPVITFTGGVGSYPWTFTYRINGGSNQTISTLSTNTTRTITVPTGTVGTFTYELVSVADAFCSQDVTGQSLTVNVIDPPAPVISGLSSTYCVLASAVTISGNYAGGTFTGPGITDNGNGTAIFDPAAAGTGAKNIFYSYNNGACSNATSQTIYIDSIVKAGTITAPATVCILTPTNLTLTGATSGGVWSSSDASIISVNASTGQITGQATGTATITYTKQTGCGSPVSTTSSTITIIKNNAGAISGPVALCKGSNITLTSDGDAGGVWSSTNTSAATINASTGVISAVSADPAVTFYYIKSGCGPTPDTAEFVMAIQEPISISIDGLDPTYCASSTATVTIYGDQQPLGTFSGLGVTDNGDGSASFSPSAAGVGTRSVTYTYNDGVCTSTTSQQVNILPNVTAGTVHDTVVCVNSNIQLVVSGATAGGSWDSNDPSIASVTSTGLVTGIASGTVTVHYELTSGCGASLASPVMSTGILTVNPLPSAGLVDGPVSLCTGSTGTYSSDGDAGGTWSSSNTAVATVNASGVVTALTAGSTTISYSVTNGCGTDVASYPITVSVCNSTVNVKAYIQGFYDAGSLAPALLNSGVGVSGTECDTIIVEIHDASNGNIIGNPVRAILNTDGTAHAIFPALSGSHYIVLKHRSAMETWSANPVALGSTVNYDFTTAASQAYGDNQVNVGNNVAPVFAMWNGDLNQDGIVETTDYTQMENDVVAILFGYYNSDLTGDGVVETSDYTIMENNVIQIIFVARPY